MLRTGIGNPSAAVVPCCVKTGEGVGIGGGTGGLGTGGTDCVCPAGAEIKEPDESGI